jgi:hypothetical protein
MGSLGSLGVSTFRRIVGRETNRKISFQAKATRSRLDSAPRNLLPRVAAFSCPTLGSPTQPRVWSFIVAHKQVPRLRIAIEKANRNAALGMTDFSLGMADFSKVSGAGID